MQFSKLSLFYSYFEVNDTKKKYLEFFIFKFIWYEWHSIRNWDNIYPDFARV